VSKAPQSPPTNSTRPPEAWEPLFRVARLATKPLDRFLRIEASSGVLLLITTAVALVWANSAWRESYHALWQSPVGIRLGTFAFERTLEWVVNDGLMVVFFFVAGVEIRRELHYGELSEWRRASLPAFAALGGMVFPVLLYFVLAGTGPARSGWGVPMATDIAFALGVLALLSHRIPPALRVLLLALAVIDDLGAIIVIALFHTSSVDVQGFVIAAGAFLAIWTMQRVGVRSKPAYVIPGVVAWAGIYSAGVHPTIAGVVIGLMTPVRAWLGVEGFVVEMTRDLESISERTITQTLALADVARREAISPAESLLDMLHPWVAYGIMPVFALANAGVVLDSVATSDASTLVLVSTGVALLVGKPVGVLIACYVALKLKISVLPRGLTARHLLVLGVVAGVGFTMALFLGQLSFSDPVLLNAAKRGVLVSSAVAATVALLLGRFLLPMRVDAGAALTADEAESSTEV